MRFINSRRTKFVAAVVGVVAMTVAASRQLYLYFLVNQANGSPGAQGGRYHLWLALAALLMTCVAGGLTFLFSLDSGDEGGGLRDA